MTAAHERQVDALTDAGHAGVDTTLTAQLALVEDEEHALGDATVGGTDAASVAFPLAACKKRENERSLRPASSSR